MLACRALQRGITMVEVIMSVAVIAVVLAIGIPNFSTWLQNTQIRTTAESVLTGLQLARAEAVRQNVRTRFQFATPAGAACSSMGCWTVTTDSLTAQGTFPAANQVQTSSAAASGQNARLGVSSATPAASNCCASAITAGTGMSSNPLPGVVFSAFGQVASDSSVTNVTRIDITNSSDANAKRLVILISSSGTARMCDPSLPSPTAASSPNSRGCP